MAATKTVQGYFGPKQVTRDEYIKQWTVNISEIYWLTDTAEESKEVESMRNRLVEMAGRKWDKIKD